MKKSLTHPSLYLGPKCLFLCGNFPEHPPKACLSYRIPVHTIYNFSPTLFKDFYYPKKETETESSPGLKKNTAAENHKCETLFSRIFSD